MLPGTTESPDESEHAVKVAKSAMTRKTVNNAPSVRQSGHYFLG
jgi:hypothetical protein